jgi:hypothetical protein
MHYTWGAVFNMPNGTKEWEFDKRYYTEPEHEQKASRGTRRADTPVVLRAQLRPTTVRSLDAPASRPATPASLAQVPKIPPPPPFKEGWKLQDGLPVTRDLYDIIKLMIDTMNAGIDLIKAEGLA